MLRGLIGQPLTKVQTPEQLMAERETLPRPADAKGAAGAIDPAVAAGMVHDLLDQHYRRCLDEPFGWMWEELKFPSSSDDLHRSGIASRCFRTNPAAWLGNLSGTRLVIQHKKLILVRHNKLFLIKHI